jgi:glycosyltransferase involved in cell wall biosynthesis
VSAVQSKAAPNISVVVPTYNRAELLRATLASLTRQTITADEFEVIVADDGSSDATYEVVESFSSRLHVAYYFQEDKGFRAAAARNGGARLASSSILLFLDTGTVASPNLLYSHIKAHSSQPATKAIIGYAYGYRHWNPLPGLAVALDQNNPEDVVRMHVGNPAFLDWRHDEFAEVESEINQREPSWMLFWSLNCSLQASDFWKVGGFDEQFCGWGPEDMELAYRIFLAGIPFEVSRDAWVIEAPHDRDQKDRLRSTRHLAEYFYEKHQQPIVEVFLAVLMKNKLLYPTFYHECREFLDWCEHSRSLDIREELETISSRVPPGETVAIFGCGEVIPLSLSRAILCDYDQGLLIKALKKPADRRYNVVGLRNPLASNSVDHVIFTSRMQGLWARWHGELLAEADRIARKTHVLFNAGANT